MLNIVDRIVTLILLLRFRLVGQSVCGLCPSLCCGLFLLVDKTGCRRTSNICWQLDVCSCDFAFITLCVLSFCVLFRTPFAVAGALWLMHFVLSTFVFLEERGAHLSLTNRSVFVIYTIDVVVSCCVWIYVQGFLHDF